MIHIKNKRMKGKPELPIIKLSAMIDRYLKYSDVSG